MRYTMRYTMRHLLVIQYLTPSNRRLLHRIVKCVLDNTNIIKEQKILKRYGKQNNYLRRSIRNAKRIHHERQEGRSNTIIETNPRTPSNLEQRHRLSEGHKVLASINEFRREKKMRTVQEVENHCKWLGNRQYHNLKKWNAVCDEKYIKGYLGAIEDVLEFIEESDDRGSE